LARQESSIGWLGTTRRIELPWFGSEKKKTPGSSGG
jgi:hypothetical protein